MNLPASTIIRSATALSPVPLVPEILLHQAAEPIGTWERTEQALGTAGLPPPFWAFAWPGGQALGRYLLDNPGAVRGQRVLDLASGSGLAAIAAALAGAAEVTACDVDPLAVAAITLNAAVNHVSVTASGEDMLAAPDRPWPGAGLVLIADAFYERDLAAKVMRFAERARAHGAAVLAADPGRAYLPRDLLIPLASYDVPGLSALEGTDTRRTTVWAPRAATGPGPAARHPAR
jgi:predicted nicotinamide N-methyase